MTEYCEIFDAVYNPTTDKWLEAKCGCTTTDECYFKCWTRPDKPSQVKR